MKLSLSLISTFLILLVSSSDLVNHEDNVSEESVIEYQQELLEKSEEFLERQKKIELRIMHQELKKYRQEKKPERIVQQTVNKRHKRPINYISGQHIKAPPDTDLIKQQIKPPWERFPNKTKHRKKLNNNKTLVDYHKIMNQRKKKIWTTIDDDDDNDNGNKTPISNQNKEMMEFRRRRRLEYQYWKVQQQLAKPQYQGGGGGGVNRNKHSIQKPIRRSYENTNLIKTSNDQQSYIGNINQNDSQNIIQQQENNDKIIDHSFDHHHHHRHNHDDSFLSTKATLKTVWGEHLLNHSKFIPHPKYPRPELVRNNNNQKQSKISNSNQKSLSSSVWWQILNGFWDYAISRMDEAYDPMTAKELSWVGKIRVPFPLESQLANIESEHVIKLEPKHFLWYKRSFRLSMIEFGSNGGGQQNDINFKISTNNHLRYYLNFEAVDYACMVWVNDIQVGGHRGGNTPFRLDISDAVAALELPGARNDLMAHELLVRVEDSTSEAQLRGKQSLHPHGIWYSRVSGIWQSVWLEAVPATHISKLKITSVLGSAILNPTSKPNPNQKVNAFSSSSSSSSSSTLEKDEEEKLTGSNHGVFKVKVVLDSAPPSTTDPNLGGGEFGDDEEEEEDKKKQKNKKKKKKKKKTDIDDDDDDDDDNAFMTKKNLNNFPWSQSAKLHAEVDVYAAGSAGGFAGSRSGQPATSVMLDLLEPMGIVTRVEGNNLLIIGVKPGGQAQVAGVRENYFIARMNGIEVRTFNEVQSVLSDLKNAFVSAETTNNQYSKTNQEKEQEQGIKTGFGSRYYTLELTPTVKVGFGTCSFFGYGETTLANPSIEHAEESIIVSKKVLKNLNNLISSNAKITGRNKASINKVENEYMKAANEGLASWDFTTLQPDPSSSLDIPSHQHDENDIESGGGGGGGSVWKSALNNQQAHENEDEVNDRGVKRRDECIAEIVIASPMLWSPSSPFLYDFVVRIMHEKTNHNEDDDERIEIDKEDTTKKSSSKLIMIDEVGSYGAMRSITRTRDSDGHIKFILNGQPLFMLGTLDQGWWPDGLLTPPSDAAQVHDIEFLKASGYNTIRKHAKVENRRYYYHCDRLGMLVWQDQVSADEDGRGATSLSPKSWTRLNKDRPEEGTWKDIDHAQFMGEFEAMVDMLENHPCIVIWVPFNEAWGQHRTVEVAAWISKRDPSRLVNAASGGNFWPVGDFADNHNYPNPSFPFFIPDRPDLEQPLQDYAEFIKVVGEFGGHGLAVPGHLWNDRGAGENDAASSSSSFSTSFSGSLGGDNNGGGQGGAWGYGKLPATTAEFKERYRVSIAALRELQDQGIAGGIYTQTTDVEGEVNGLLTYDRKVAKIDPSELKEWHMALFNLERIMGKHHLRHRKRF